jgi:monoamine oxidase
VLLRSGFENRVRSLYSGTGGPDPVFQPVGGMQAIPDAFARAMGERVRLGAEVVSIRQSEDAVTVTWKDTATGRVSEEVADYCVCCLPMSVLKTIDVDLSDDLAASVAETAHSGSAKMGLQMRRRFWEEDEGIFGGHLWSRSLELGEFSYPSNDYFTRKGVLLGYYGGGDQAGLSDRSIAQRIEHVLERAGRVHPQMREEFESAYAVWWEKVPYSRGAYSRTPSTELREALSKPDRRLYLGSAGTSPRPAWIEGAVGSAWRTVQSLHERAMQEQ